MNSPDLRSEFNYDQFVNLSYADCCKLMFSKGGPKMAAMEQELLLTQQQSTTEKKQQQQK